MQYPAMPNFTYPQQYVQPYQDRLAQLQSQYQQTIPQQMQTQQNSQGLLYVQGEAGAKAYMVAPNNTVLLMDSEAPMFYIKSVNAAGIPTMQTFEYKEVINAPAVQQAPQDLDAKYVTRQEHDDLTARYEELQSKYSEIMEKINSFPAAALDGEPAKRTTARTAPARGKGGTDNG